MSIYKNARCRICNSVSCSEISSDYGEFSGTAFRMEEDGLGFLCDECVSEIDDVETEWNQEDQT